MTISVCMIVKNEEAVLQRCLDSIGHLWHELIVVDTGSTDRTVEIAKHCGAKVLHYDWVAPGNKGEARNFGIEQATGEWIVIIDADEVLSDAVAAREIILGSQADALAVQFRNFVDGHCNLAWQQVRIFRRGTHVYKYREHEVPVPTKENAMMQPVDIVFEHRTPEGRGQGKSAPMMQRLELDVEENPDDPHPLYFLHRECLNQDQNERAIHLGYNYLKLTRNKNYIKAEVHSNMSLAHERLGQFDEACKRAHLAVACEPNKREWLYRLAVLYMNHSAWSVAAAMARAALELLPNETHQWEPQTTARLYDLIDTCRHEAAHAMAHSHSH